VLALVGALARACVFAKCLLGLLAASMPSSSRSSSFARGGRNGAATGFVQYMPSAHSEHQYEGMLKGVGVTSKEPICSKRNTATKRLHDATHFAIGCKKWDDAETRGVSTTHNTFTDPEVIYATRDAPDKNASIVELRQREHMPEVHYRTEQRERFEHPGPQPRDEPFDLGLSKVHFGDDRPEIISQTGLTHFRPPDAEAYRSAALRSAGVGALVANTVWPKPPRCNPITGGPRLPDNHDYGVQAAMQFGRISANKSNIVWEHNHRDPVLGHHVPHASYVTPHTRSTTQLINDANYEAPPMRSLGALRPRMRSESPAG